MPLDFEVLGGGMGTLTRKTVRVDGHGDKSLHVLPQLRTSN